MILAPARNCVVARPCWSISFAITHEYLACDLLDRSTPGAASTRGGGDFALMEMLLRNALVDVPAGLLIGSTFQDRQP